MLAGYKHLVEYYRYVTGIEPEDIRLVYNQKMMKDYLESPEGIAEAAEEQRIREERSAY